MARNCPNAPNYALTMDCDLEKSLYYKEKLIQKDIFHSYTNTLLIFDTLYFTDAREPQKCLNLLEEHQAFFKASLDQLLVRNYSYFISYYLLNNNTKVKYYYSEII